MFENHEGDLSQNLPEPIKRVLINHTKPTSTLSVCYYHVTYEVQSESTLYSLPECQGTPCWKQAPYLKFK